MASPRRTCCGLAAAVERESEHPLAEAIARHANQRGIDSPKAMGFENIPGHGATAQVGGRRVTVGNHRLMDAAPASHLPSAAPMVCASELACRGGGIC